MSRVVSFGEILWDKLPSGKVPGGAPLNFGYRLNSFEKSLSIISKVGDDSLGKGLTEFLNKSRLETKHIQISKIYKTGEVNVSIDKNGIADYDILNPVAWDNISLNSKNIDLTKNSSIFVFGSLICRNMTSRRTLKELLKIAPFKLFDINLRSPYYNMNLIEELMLSSDFIKFNYEEIEEISSIYINKKANLENMIETISEKTKTKNICVTMGEKGACYYTNNSFYYQDGFKINVLDTVGAGDSFLATLVEGILNKTKPQEILKKACAVAALVASKEGATPTVSMTEINDLLVKK
ncbi:MAG: carbohydrate kinase [Flavobacteriales bacterium TMED96]|nr:MAG: carbohydrate kinase [Flavobacteriales bacterium TMED96]|tara:strand:+ start:830 stop:1714 length:885 start_codon:yes stop_codon:yes gene_type:complete